MSHISDISAAVSAADIPHSHSNGGRENTNMIYERGKLMTIQNHMEKLAEMLKNNSVTQYNIVLKKTPSDGCLSIDDVIRMSRMLTGIDMVPITIRGKTSCAMGFINHTDAEFMGYDFEPLVTFVCGMLRDDLPMDGREYAVSHRYGESSIYFIKQGE